MRTPVIHPRPLAILGEPVPTMYVVDSMMVILTKKEDLYLWTSETHSISFHLEFYSPPQVDVAGRGHCLMGGTALKGAWP